MTAAPPDENDIDDDGEQEDGGEGFRWPTANVGVAHPLADAPNARERAAEFVRFAEAALAGIPYKEAKAVFGVSSNQAETRKSLLEQMGLLYVPRASNHIIVTPVGRQLYDLLAPGTFAEETATHRRINAVIAWALSNSQINRPRGSPGRNTAQWASSDIRPYAAGWQAVLDLDGWLALDEFFGVLWHVRTVAEYQPAITAIRALRAEGRQLVDPNRLKDGDLMNPRIYWTSHLSSGSTVLTLTADGARLELRPDARDLVTTVLRFAGGCASGGSREVSFAARPFNSVDEYFENIGGRACPEFLFSRSMRVEDLSKERITFLDRYKAEEKGQEINLSGGPELCSIPLNAPCYHKSIPDRLLRLAVKEESNDYKVVLRLERGRYVTGDILALVNKQ